ncbi:MAG TPA: cytochrome c maturation protein CcmE [Candidatus Limnocylindrales bacterium]|nr:cytochrome c maturation protein CcmE [Candidatus Limnocylindrales bacterium]
MNRSYKFLVGIAVIVATVGFLMWTAVDQTKMYMITVAEFLSAGDSYAGETVRIAGRVAPGTMKWDATSRDLRFTLKDITREGTVDVHYNGLLPDMFAEDRDVVVEGPYTDETPFRATTVLTACPSKYQAEE